jgi:hypothetical protein
MVWINMFMSIEIWELDGSLKWAGQVLRYGLSGTMSMENFSPHPTFLFHPVAWKTIGKDVPKFFFSIEIYTKKNSDNVSLVEKEIWGVEEKLSWARALGLGPIHTTFILNFYKNFLTSVIKINDR